MRPISLAIAAAALVVLATPAAFGEQPESREPPLQFYFEVDGKQVPLELDQPFAVQQLGGAKSATLRVRPHRDFAYGGLRFRYPREYTFEADFESPKVTLWTLSGNDCKLMVQRFNFASEAEEIRRAVVDQLLETYGEAKKSARPVKLEVGGTVLKGTRVDVELAGTQLHQDVYSVAVGKESLVLIIQDSPKDGQSSADRASAQKLLVQTLQLPK